MRASKRFQMRHNVTFRVLERSTGKLISELKGHNAATNTMLEGIGHYLAGEGVLHQGAAMLSDYVPRYISLGTMGLMNQDEDETGLPEGISGYDPKEDEEDYKFQAYIDQCPGFGADGYSKYYNNDRPYMGLGPAYSSFSISSSYYKGDVVYYDGVEYKANKDIISNPEAGKYIAWHDEDWDKVADLTCYELISPTSPRQEISFREVIPEYEAENPETIDVVFSAMIPSSILEEFMGDRNYLFVTEAGLWSDRQYQSDSVGVNSLLAGYRLIPPDNASCYMTAESVPDYLAIAYCVEHGQVPPTEEEIEAAKIEISAANRQTLKENILRVERGQVIQVIWRVEIGNIEERRGGDTMPSPDPDVPTTIEELYRLLLKKIVYAEDIVVPTSSWVSSDSSEFPYSAEIYVEDVDSTYFSAVQFKDEDVENYNFSSDSKTTQSTVTIYCKEKPNKTIEIPLITCTKGNKVQARAH